MKKTTGIFAAAVAAALIASTGLPTTAAAQCVKKAGQGTGGDVSSAKFQAYEAILQATDWGAWASWMMSSQKVGVAPGYRVSGLRSRCRPGGLGQSCVVQATLCKS